MLHYFLRDVPYIDDAAERFVAYESETSSKKIDVKELASVGRAWWKG